VNTPPAAVQLIERVRSIYRAQDQRDSTSNPRPSRQLPRTWAVPGEPFEDPRPRGTTIQKWRSTVRSLHNEGSIRTPSATEIDGLIDEFRGFLEADRRWLNWAVLQPWVWMEELLQPSSEGNGPPSQQPSLYEWWSMCCWAAEALHRATQEPSCLLPADRPVTEPLVARLRFLILTEPLRYRGEPAVPLGWIRRGSNSRLDSSPFEVILGDNTWDQLVARTRESRWLWLVCLDGFTIYPPLVQAGNRQLEHEIRAVVFQATTKGHRWRPLTIRPAMPDRTAPSGPDDQAVQIDVVEKHLLPRFALCSVIMLALHPNTGHTSARRRSSTAASQQHPVRGLLNRIMTRLSTGWRSLASAVVMPMICTVLVAALWLGTVWLVFHHDIRLAGWTAAGTYTALAFGVVINGPLFASIWLLRWPAAGTIGLIALIGLNPAWWKNTSLPDLTIGTIEVPPTVLLLISAALGYLIIEARNHRVTSIAAVIRAIAVLVIGTAHGMLIALLGLLVAIPQFSEDGAELLSTLTGPDHTASCRLLVNTIAWCLCTGVFSQILWDDRSITAPLAHICWQAGRPR
jgi:hypothetical protein